MDTGLDPESRLLSLARRLAPGWTADIAPSKPASSQVEQKWKKKKTIIWELEDQTI